MSRSKNYISYKPRPPIPFSQIFTAASDDLIALLYTLLALNPDDRGTATSALASAYFRNRPAPTPEAQLPKPKNTMVACLLQQEARQTAAPVDPISMFDSAELSETPLNPKRKRVS